MAKFCTIYQVTHNPTGKVYIGCHQTDDLNDDYMGSGIHITRAIRKFGKDQFSKQILHVFNTPEEMYSKEAELVNEEFVLRDDTYNVALGGKGGWTGSPEQKKVWAINASRAAAEKRRGQKDPEHVRRKRAATLSQTLSGVPRPNRLKTYIINGKVCVGRDAAISEAGVSVSRIKSSEWDWCYG